MAKYKIIEVELSEGDITTSIMNIDTGINCPVCPGNSEYDQFLADVKDQGISIVEGPDIVTESYVALRVKEYPSIEEQFDMQFWDNENGTSHWKDTIETIKNKYPKTISATTTIGPLPEWVQKLVE